MKKYLCLIVFLNWFNLGLCQIEREWSSALDMDFFYGCYFCRANQWPKATYILQLINESKTMTAKFIKM